MTCTQRGHRSACTPVPLACRNFGIFVTPTICQYTLIRYEGLQADGSMCHACQQIQFHLSCPICNECTPVVIENVIYIVNILSPFCLIKWPVVVLWQSITTVSLRMGHADLIFFWVHLSKKGSFFNGATQKSIHMCFFMKFWFIMIFNQYINFIESVKVILYSSVTSYYALMIHR